MLHGEAGKDETRSQRNRDPRQPRVSIKHCYERRTGCRQKHHKDAQTGIDPEKIRNLGHHQLRFLHRCCGKAEVAKGIGEVDHDRNHRDQAVIFRCEEARQDHGRNNCEAELYRLGSKHHCATPGCVSGQVSAKMIGL